MTGTGATGFCSAALALIAAGFVSSVSDDDAGREGKGSVESGLPRLMVATTATMVVLTVTLTGIAGPLYGLADRAAADLLERTPYVDAVFGDGPVP